MKHKITRVAPDSIAHQLDIAPGDILLSIDTKTVCDVLDYRFFCRSERLVVEVEKPDGELWELDIEKDEDEELGLSFEAPLMDKPKACQNKCLFCFIDQLPPNLRETLYFKDDDPRLSFLTGNYVTLTNLSPDDIRRIAYYHLSPMHVSVHAASLPLRAKMLGGTHKKSPLFEYLRILNEAGITLHFQIVLCKGLNDGAQLDHTIEVLSAIRPGAASLSVVPAGLTQFRQGLHPLAPFGPRDAAAVIAQVADWQARCRKQLGTAFVFCADEWYLLADQPLPAYDHYEDFPQLENGVGMMALFERQFAQTFKPNALPRVGIVTGQAAAGFMRRLVKDCTPPVQVYEIINRFFGPHITVSGLLTGKDIIEQLKGKTHQDLLLVPQNAFKADEDIMLDGTTLQQLSQALGTTVKKGSTDGGLFAGQLGGCPREASPRERLTRPD